MLRIEISVGTADGAWDVFRVKKYIDSWPFVIVLGLLAWFLLTWDGGEEGSNEEGSKVVSRPPFTYSEPTNENEMGELTLKVGEELITQLKMATDEASAKRASKRIESLVPVYVSLRKFSNVSPAFKRVWMGRIIEMETECEEAKESALENTVVGPILRPVLERLDDAAS